MPKKTAPEEKIEVANKFMVASRGEEIIFLRPIPTIITRQDALLLAAYVVSMVADEERWQRTLEAVQRT